MSPREALIVLQVGEAVAVLIDIGHVAQGDRDAAASRALRHATARPDVTIGRRPTGRPRLAAPWPELGVSLAVREPLLLAGITPVGRVGVDIEPDADRVVADPCAMARDHFSAGEAAAVAALDVDRARSLFLRLWVAKEAALKLTGRGVYDGLAQPDLAQACGDLARDGVVVQAALDGTVRLKIVVRRLETPAGPMLAALARDDGGA
jgi:4'-phosphopantetheinyl transferase